MEKAFINWSGGKDCTMALHEILEQKKYSVEFLFTTLSRQFQRVSMHGVRKELITRQALALGIHSRKLYLPEQTSMNVYDQFMANEMVLMKERGIHHSIFGDIFLEDLRKYREEKLKSSSIQAHFPLWKKDTRELLKRFLGLGYKTTIVSIDKRKLDEKFLGRDLDESFLNELPSDVDPCGENGEFHTFVYDGPIFKEQVKMQKGEIVKKNYTHDGNNFEYAFLDLIPLT
jgi:uncharacterized protein (TIGR00290 family)